MSFKVLGQRASSGAVYDIHPSFSVFNSNLPQHGIFDRVYANAFHLALLGNRVFLKHKSKPFFSVVHN